MTPSIFNFVFLHGTLQRSSVWSNIIESLREEGARKKCFTVGKALAPDLYLDNPLDLETWLEDLDAKITGKNNILIGYSLGGRFALDLYQRNSEKYQALVLVCTDPGLEDRSAESALLANDDKWEKRFREMQWSEMMELWNSLPTFCGKPNNNPPIEGDFDRESLARLWKISSKARNPSLWGVVKNLSVPTLAISGELDLKFTEIAKRIKQVNPSVVEHVSLPELGHRVPWEGESKFLAVLVDFLRRTF